MLAIAINAALGRGLWQTMFAVGMSWWPSYARLVRGQILSVANNEYVGIAGGDNQVVDHLQDTLSLSNTGGIKTGLAIALVGLGALWLIRNPKQDLVVRYATSAAIFCIGLYWTVERIPL